MQTLVDLATAVVIAIDDANHHLVIQRRAAECLRYADTYCSLRSIMSHDDMIECDAEAPTSRPVYGLCCRCRNAILPDNDEHDSCHRCGGVVCPSCCFNTSCRADANTTVPEQFHFEYMRLVVDEPPPQIRMALSALLVAYAWTSACAPDEAGGYLLGSDAVVTHFVPLENVLARRTSAYEPNLDSTSYTRDDRPPVIGWLHSHPEQYALTPSMIDVQSTAVQQRHAATPFVSVIVRSHCDNAEVTSLLDLVRALQHDHVVAFVFERGRPRKRRVLVYVDDIASAIGDVLERQHELRDVDGAMSLLRRLLQ